MDDLEQAVQAIEHGLLKPKDEQEHPAEKMGLIERMPHYKVPGISIALVDNGELVWAKEYGLMGAGKDRQVTTKTIFQVSSISKPVSAMVALHLVEADYPIPSLFFTQPFSSQLFSQIGPQVGARDF